MKNIYVKTKILWKIFTLKYNCSHNCGTISTEKNLQTRIPCRYLRKNLHHLDDIITNVLSNSYIKPR